MENVAKRANFELVHEKKRMNKILSVLTFKSYIEISKDVYLVEKYNKTTVLNKPMQIGFSILEMSKIFMYEFYYNYVVKNYGYENVKLCMTDTDSLLM